MPKWKFTDLMILCIISAVFHVILAFCNTIKAPPLSCSSQKTYNISTCSQSSSHSSCLALIFLLLSLPLSPPLSSSLSLLQNLQNVLGHIDGRWDSRSIGRLVRCLCWAIKDKAALPSSLAPVEMGNFGIRSVRPTWHMVMHINNLFL